MSEVFETFNKQDNTRLSGRYWPAKNAKAVMSLVHGLGEHSGRYESLAPDLVKAGISVLAVDLRGHGKSDGKRGVCTDYNLLHDDLEALLEKSRSFYPDTPHFLYGHSLGGGLVLDYGFSAADDIKAIITSAPFIGLPKPPPAILRGVAKIMRKLNPQGTMSQPLTGEKISSLSEEQERYVNDPINHSQLGFGLAVDSVEAGERISRKAEQWKRPLLLMHARGDQLTDFSASEHFSQTGQNVTFKAFENSEHEMHHDTPREAVLSAMIDFINANI